MNSAIRLASEKPSTISSIVSVSDIPSPAFLTFLANRDAENASGRGRQRQLLRTNVLVLQRMPATQPFTFMLVPS